MKHVSIALMSFAMPALAACGGGGAPSGGGAATVAGPAVGGIPTGLPAASSSPASAAFIGGTVVQIPVDAYGPATIDGAIYASADAAQSAPLADATVIAGPVPVAGATAPAVLPAGDVSAVTNAAGVFQMLVATPPAPPASGEPFVIPPDNILDFVPPARGYYVEVFGAGTDGTSAGAPIPLHRFVAASSQLALRVSTTSSAEAGALAAVNSDRAANNAGALIFDEAAEEVARLHAGDESAIGYTCHYDTRNVGPASRYLAAGGIGLTGEGLALAAGTSSLAFRVTETAFMAEKTLAPPGGHYLNLVDPAHAWAGLAAVVDASAPAFVNVDYDLVTPSAVDSIVGASGYTNAGSCPSGIVVNDS